MGKEEWEGTPTELLAELVKFVDDKTQKSKVWPKAANALTRQLNRLSNFLRRIGIEVDTKGRGNKKRTIIIRNKKGDDTLPGDDIESLGDDILKNTVHHSKCGKCGEEITLLKRNNQLYLFNKDETDIHKCQQPELEP